MFEAASLQELWGKFGSSDVASSSDVGNLKDLFSDKSKENFERLIKPEEFIVPKRPKLDDESEVKGKNKRKKERKPKRPKVDESLDAEVGVDNKEGVAAESGDSTNDPSALPRTVFIGNIPLTETVKSIRHICQEFGDVESLRLRSVPIAGTAVDDNGNQNLVKKVCSNSRQFGEQKGSFNAYVVFKEAASVGKALAANNRMIGNRHLRFDRVPPTLFDPRRSLFIGNLHHYADEEALRRHFAAVCNHMSYDVQ